MNPKQKPKRRPSSLRLRSYELQTEIGRLLGAGHHELAVLLSQTLLEIRVEAELIEYFEILQEDTFSEAAFGLLASYNIGNHRTRGFFETLVGVRLSEEDPKVMRELQLHNTRRNRIAHAGEKIDESEAQDSVRAVRAVCALVHELSFRSLGLDDELDEERRQEALMQGEIEEDWEA